MRLVLIGLLLSANFVAAQSFEIKATMTYPAGESETPQPTGLYVDSRTGDIYVADAFSARIAIYDSQRRFNFEFSTRDRLGSPQQVIVDSLGRIFVLGDTREHTLAVFDYNGEFLNYLELGVNETRLSPVCIAFDASDNLYALTAEPMRAYVFTSNASPVRDFSLLLETDLETQNTPILGNLSIADDELIISLPVVGQVARVSLDGKLIRIFGVPGGGPTELSHPIACNRTVSGEFVVLDKHRHLLQYFDASGNYLREIGGAGMNEGWFFHPSSLASCLDGALVVGQMYKNRIQSVVFRNAPVASGS